MSAAPLALADALRCPGAADALRALERECIAAAKPKFMPSLILEAMAEGVSGNRDHLEEIVAGLARPDERGRAAVRFAISLCGLERAKLMQRLVGLGKGGDHV